MATRSASLYLNIRKPDGRWTFARPKTSNNGRLRSSRFQKPEDVTSKFARSARLRIDTRCLGLKQRAEYLGPASFEVAVSLKSALQ
jgi:hypothetical protein